MIAVTGKMVATTTLFGTSRCSMGLKFCLQVRLVLKVVAEYTFQTYNSLTRSRLTVGQIRSLVGEVPSRTQAQGAPRPKGGGGLALSQLGRKEPGHGRSRGGPLRRTWTCKWTVCGVYEVSHSHGWELEDHVGVIREVGDCIKGVSGRWQVMPHRPDCVLPQLRVWGFAPP